MTLLHTLTRWFRRSLNCEAVNRFIVDYLEDALPEPTRARFERHLAACPACRVYLEQYVQTVDLVHEAGAEPLDPPAELVDATLAFLRASYDDDVR